MKKASPIIRKFSCALVVALGMAGCATKTPPAPQPQPQPGQPPQVKAPTPEEIAERNEILKGSAQAKRDAWKNKRFEDFEAKVYREPFAGGKYIVNGDTPIRDQKQLREFFEQLPAATEPPPIAGLTLGRTADGLDMVWNSSDKRKLTYCISKQFGANYDAVVNAMTAATGAWEAVANVNFDHLTAEDANCTATNGNVKFDVRPVNVNGEYLARAFFPNDPRASRNVLIDNTSFQLDPNEKLTLVGILRHELGHTLGFRHEHTRPDSGKCFEDNNWRPLTTYDAFSVMHYPQCNGMGDWSLNLTPRDKNGSACVYGAAAGFSIDTSICEATVTEPIGDGGTPKTDTFANQRVTRNQTKNYGPFAVKPGTVLQVSMTGIAPAGDPDLYVRFGLAPSRTGKAWSCRPYLSGAEESCVLDVPANQSKAYVMVYGYKAGNYKLTVTRVPPQ